MERLTTGQIDELSKANFTNLDHCITLRWVKAGPAITKTWLRGIMKFQVDPKMWNYFIKDSQSQPIDHQGQSVMRR